ncbi:hypothetical protein PROFUN_08709 [Planoprotostelium fungivorum]|uniref:RING-type domain-containing protein n=1 Tax=Planoprotostelium fungivorum TaxID=1890364 RepID=A0A2P6MQV7_9EUKA|nr:hypothetical protein PROFUN_08709 [Planoprotostelium fungivorum]
MEAQHNQPPSVEPSYLAGRKFKKANANISIETIVKKVEDVGLSDQKEKKMVTLEELERMEFPLRELRLEQLERLSSVLSSYSNLVQTEMENRKKKEEEECCVICMDNHKNVAAAPCGHLVDKQQSTCAGCSFDQQGAFAFKECPMYHLKQRKAATAKSSLTIHSYVRLELSPLITVLILLIRVLFIINVCTATRRHSTDLMPFPCYSDPTTLPEFLNKIYYLGGKDSGQHMA